MKICELNQYGQIEIIDQGVLAAVQGGAASSPNFVSTNGGCTNEADCLDSTNAGVCGNHGSC